MGFFNKLLKKAIQIFTIILAVFSAIEPIVAHAAGQEEMNAA